MIKNDLKGGRNIEYSVVLLLILSTTSASFPESINIGELTPLTEYIEETTR